MLKLLLLTAFCVWGAEGQGDSYCQYIKDRTCTSDKKEEVCGTDNVTYRNRCEYAKVFCLNKNIHLQNYGPCTNSVTTKPTTQPPFVMSTMDSTPMPTPAPTNQMTVPTTPPKPINGSLIALDIFCLDLNYVDCPIGGARVCGSDGKFYENVCEFDKQRCFHRDLHSRTSGCV